MATSDERIGRGGWIRLRDACIATLEAMFPSGPVQVFKHRGKWTHESLRHYTAAAPCIAVVYNGASNWETNGDTSSTGFVSFTAFIVTVDDPHGGADDDALALSDLLTTVIPGNNWGLPEEDASPAEDVDGLNVYTSKLDDTGCNVHAVSWLHQITSNRWTAAEIAALPDFLRAHTTMRVGDPAEDDDVPDETDSTNLRDP